LIVIVGPTGAGKTSLALALAGRLGAEVVSADSQQVYRGMDIGTGKVPASERDRVPHHLIDAVDPDEEMTAARFVALADRAIASIASRGKRVVVAGGTGLYVRALLLGLFPGPPANPQLRAELAAQEVSALYERLQVVDPAAAARIEPRDRRRIIRALEVTLITGTPMSEHQRQHDHRRIRPRYRAQLIGLAPPRDRLYAAINRRVDEMLADGLVQEVEDLRARGYRPPLRSQQAIGYAEVHQYLDGRVPLAEAVELIKRNTRRYARRQLTWYRPEESIVWYSSAANVPLEPLAKESYAD
jgi:tRNA dimethylallyltransferase